MRLRCPGCGTLYREEDADDCQHCGTRAMAYSRSTFGIVVMGARRLLNGARRSIGSMPRRYRSVTSRRA